MAINQLCAETYVSVLQELTHYDIPECLLDWLERWLRHIVSATVRE
jgi:hypothetical protein